MRSDGWLRNLKRMLLGPWQPLPPLRSNNIPEPGKKESDEDYLRRVLTARYSGVMQNSEAWVGWEDSLCRNDLIKERAANWYGSDERVIFELAASCIFLFSFYLYIPESTKPDDLKKAGVMLADELASELDMNVGSIWESNKVWGSGRLPGRSYIRRIYQYNERDIARVRDAINALAAEAAEADVGHAG